MDIISYRKIQEELRKTCDLDPECSALILDIGSGELVAVSGSLPHTDASNIAGSFYVIWNAQLETAGQHDDKLESVMVSNNDKDNFLVGIPNVKSRSSEDGFLLAVSVPKESVEFGALKRSTEQTANTLQSLLYAIRKK